VGGEDGSGAVLGEPAGAGLDFDEEALGEFEGIDVEGELKK